MPVANLPAWRGLGNQRNTRDSVPNLNLGLLECHSLDYIVLTSFGLDADYLQAQISCTEDKTPQRLNGTRVPNYPNYF
jgi:hypothetical protein